VRYLSSGLTEVPIRLPIKELVEGKAPKRISCTCKVARREETVSLAAKGLQRFPEKDMVSCIPSGRQEADWGGVPRILQERSSPEMQDLLVRTYSA